MVLDFYKLREQPFGVSPDSRFLFMGPSHSEALASLLYGVEAGCGFMALIAKPGLGKTTLLYHALNQLREKALTVFLFQTVSTPMDLLRALLAGLGVQDTQGSLVQLQLRLKESLVEQARQGKRVVVVIDEAQNLEDSVLELIRMLSNFETSQQKLIQIILSGQSQLGEKIGSPGLEQLRQRVSIFACLKPFSREDTKLYIEHRLRIAGYSFDLPLFTRDAITFIADFSDGIPRNINNLCFNSMSLGYAAKQRPIDSAIVREVIADLDPGRWKKRSSFSARPAEIESRKEAVISSAASAPSSPAWTKNYLLALVVMLIVGGLLFAMRPWRSHETAARVQSTVPTAIAPARSSGKAPQPSVPAETTGVVKSALPAQVVATPSSIEAKGTPAVPPAEVEGSEAPVLVANQTASTEQTPAQVEPESTISVKPGKTLLGICVENFGRCDLRLLQEIRRLNPGINNLDHIEPGQKIRLPVSAAITQEPGHAPGAEKEMP